MTDGQILILADTILVIHFIIAAYLTLGLPVIWLGKIFGRQFIHNPWFRYSHAGLMGFVLLESLIGMFCPLTVWETNLRRAAGQQGVGYDESFVSHWLGKILFHDFNETTYSVVYGLFFLLIALTFLFIPVRASGKKCRNRNPKEP
nr:DUF2784 domain-containing protein [uncultured Pseudodesulfovibrio sp.]